jgi:hypothetical protein
VKAHRKRPFKRRPGRPSVYDKPNEGESRTGELIVRLHYSSTAPDHVALQDARFPATDLRRRAAAEEYFKLNRAELKNAHRKRDDVLRDIASRFHIDAETFVNWMNRSRHAR